MRGVGSDRPPLQAFDDMVDQPKYKSQADGAFFADRRTMRSPTTRAVPWGPHAASPDRTLATDEQAAFAATQFPVPVDQKLMVRGQQLFDTFCAMCHGGTGSGDGVTIHYGMTVPSYHNDQRRALAVGQVYRTISEGKGIMGPYGDRIVPADRWAVVAYVRALQRAADARIGDVPAEHRSELKR